MKKSIISVMVLVFALILVACGGDKPTPPSGLTASIKGATDVTIDVGDTFDPLAGVTATDTKDGPITQINVTGTVNTNEAAIYTLTYKVTGSDGKEVTVIRKVTVKVKAVVGTPTTITIMHGAPFEVDPFHPDFSGTKQKDRQDLQRSVEAQYNVKVVYKAYPANAPWGPDRVQAIIQSSVAHNHLAEIYWTTSDWTQALSTQEAIVPVDKYMETHGKNIHVSYKAIGTYKDKFYAFNEGNLTADVGLYYNADLVKSLGVENPSQLYLDGKWNWTKFEAWSKQVQTAMSSLGDGMFPLGGMYSSYAESMIPLNGGSLINAQTGRVSFTQNPALQTYDFLNKLHVAGLFEPSATYDSGSPLWQSGKVAMHPGSLWFVKSDSRWGGLPFEIGFVPFPRADSFTGEYVSPVSGVAVYNVASGMTATKEELVFQVWNALQLWRTDAQLKADFELALLKKFDDELYVESYLDIYDKVYLELMGAIGISPYSVENGWRRNINIAIKEGTARTVVDALKPAYDDALEIYLGK